MNIKEARFILFNYNIWRRGSDIEQPNPTQIGIAIDTIINYVDYTLKDIKTKY